MTVRRVIRRLDAGGTAWHHAGGPLDESARVLIAGGFSQVNEALLSNLPSVKLVVRTGAGFENVDASLLASRGIALVAPRLESDPSVAEYVLAGILVLTRHLRQAEEAARTGDWDFRDRCLGTNLEGRTLGIVGVGRIGRLVARLGHCVGMTVLAWHPWSSRAFDSYIERVSDLRNLLERSDVVTLHCRLTDSTRRLIDASALSHMRRNAILVNTGRGGLVDEKELAACLTAGEIAGAVIDVSEYEPNTSRSPLADIANVLLTPHIAGTTEESMEALADYAVSISLRYLNSGLLPGEDRVV